MKTSLLSLLAATLIPNFAFASFPTKLACDLFVSNKITGAGAEERREASLVLSEKGFFANVSFSAEGLLLQGKAHVSTNPARVPTITLAVSNESTMKHLAFSLSEGLRTNITTENETHKAHLSCGLEE